MNKYTEITTKKIIGENGEITEHETKKVYVEKTWDELTETEKEKVINDNFESLCYNASEDAYQIYKDELEYYLREEHKNIDFDDIYIEENSQGWWIDRVKGFKANYEGVEIYGEYIELDDVDITIRRTINKITEADIITSPYYLTEKEEQRIYNTKKYKEWSNKIVEEVNKWIEDVNKIVEDYFNNCYPSVDYINNYFEEETFTYEIEG